jgi:hypothetical protein
MYKPQAELTGVSCGIDSIEHHEHHAREAQPRKGEERMTAPSKSSQVAPRRVVKWPQKKKYHGNVPDAQFA